MKTGSIAGVDHKKAIYNAQIYKFKFQVFIVLHFLEKLINILYKNAEIKKYPQLAREQTKFNRVQ